MAPKSMKNAKKNEKTAMKRGRPAKEASKDSASKSSTKDNGSNKKAKKNAVAESAFDGSRGKQFPLKKTIDQIKNVFQTEYEGVDNKDMALLCHMVEPSLSLKVEDRGPVHQQCVQMLEMRLIEIQQMLDAKLQAAQKFVVDAPAIYKDLRAGQSTLVEKETELLDKLLMARKELSLSEENLARLAKSLADAEDEHKRSVKNMAKDKEDLEYVSQMMGKSWCALLNKSNLQPADKKKQLRALANMGKTVVGVGEEVTKPMVEALGKDPRERGAFDAVVLQEFETQVTRWQQRKRSAQAAGGAGVAQNVDVQKFLVQEAKENNAQASASVVALETELEDVRAKSREQDAEAKSHYKSLKSREDELPKTLNELSIFNQLVEGFMYLRDRSDIVAGHELVKAEQALLEQALVPAGGLSPRSSMKSPKNGKSPGSSSAMKRGRKGKKDSEGNAQLALENGYDGNTWEDI